MFLFDRAERKVDPARNNITHNNCFRIYIIFSYYYFCTKIEAWRVLSMEWSTNPLTLIQELLQKAFLICLWIIFHVFVL